MMLDLDGYMCVCICRREARHTHNPVGLTYHPPPHTHKNQTDGFGRLGAPGQDAGGACVPHECVLRVDIIDTWQAASGCLRLSKSQLTRVHTFFFPKNPSLPPCSNLHIHTQILATPTTGGAGPEGGAEHQQVPFGARGRHRRAQGPPGTYRQPTRFVFVVLFLFRFVDVAISSPSPPRCV